MASKSKRRRKVLGASCILAALIIAGSSFAWFTSKDEVTNRLTATADYGVSVVEDFTPPKDMTPGQEVTKTAAAVNTGNVDAFVRVALENKLNITTYGAENVTTATTNGTATYYDKNLVTGTATDTNYAYMAYNALVTTEPSITSGQVNSKDLVVLNRTPSVSASSGVLNPDEVTTLQAGGQLVVAASNGLPVPQQFVQSGDYINTAGLTFGEFNDSGEFLPKETGLYLFRRHIGTTNEYSGYYYVAKSGGDTGGEGTYYALVTKYDTTTAPSNPQSTVYVDATITEESTGGGSVVKAISGLQLRTTETQDAVFAHDSTDNVLSYKIGYIGTATNKTGTPATMTSYAIAGDDTVTFREASTTADQKYIEVTYKKGTNTNVRFYIKLAANWSDSWQLLDDTTAGSAAKNLIDYFYLKDDLEAGKTSPALIESVTLSKLANRNDFVDLTYDINVLLDSVQVTYDADNVETTTGVASAWGVTATRDGSGAKEISSVTWANP